jgi:hypothetical protein
MIQFRPFWNYGCALHRHARQISLGKNAMFPCASAAFTLSAVSDGLRHEVPTRPPTRPSMQFLSVASHVCTQASFRQVLAALPLPSASGYHRFMTNLCRNSHRGLAPHYIAPMLGAHQRFQGTRYTQLRCVPLAPEPGRWQGYFRCPARASDCVRGLIVPSRLVIAAFGSLSTGSQA